MSLRERTRPGLGIIEPCLPSPAKVPPSGPGWLHEIKHDGFRILARGVILRASDSSPVMATISHRGFRSRLKRWRHYLPARFCSTAKPS
jgi:hypothetical protein